MLAAFNENLELSLELKNKVHFKQLCDITEDYVQGAQDMMFRPSVFYKRLIAAHEPSLAEKILKEIEIKDSYGGDI